jgi:hypothetical protein
MYPCLFNLTRPTLEIRKRPARRLASSSACLEFPFDSSDVSVGDGLVYLGGTSGNEATRKEQTREKERESKGD